MRTQMQLCAGLVALLSVSSAASIPASPFCQSQSQPNPIAKQYPDQVTGTINGTYVVLPIPVDTAKSLIPPQYGLLTNAYKPLLPGFPDGMFPALVEALLDHDVQSAGIQIPDFRRIAIKIPFVDRLNDGYSSFKYTVPQLISANAVALLGSAMYGTTVPGTFDPACDPYAADGAAGAGATVFKTYVAPGSKDTASLGSTPAFEGHFKPEQQGSPYSMDFFKNVTNQPSFGSGLPVCDNYITLFNSSVTMAPYTPVPVKGSLAVKAPFYTQDQTFTDVWGLQLDNSFIEHNNVPCEQLKGYSGTGPGD